MFIVRSLLTAAALLATFPLQAQDFPRTIAHAFGETEIETRPERVLTWGWSAHDIVLDLGVVPVGLPRVTYGGGDNGILPWTEQALEALGADTPPMLGEASGAISLEAMLALDPDVIVAPYSGITEDEYRALSAFAPVVPFREAAWRGSWQDSVNLIGEALGLEQEAATLVAETEAMIASATQDYPQIAGQRVINFVDRGDGTISVRTPRDPRSQLLIDAGLESSAEDRVDANGYTYFVSFENFSQLDADILVAFLDTPDAAEAFFAQPSIATSPLVQSGRVAVIDNEELTMAVGGSVSPLSLRWGFGQLMEKIAQAADNAID